MTSSPANPLATYLKGLQQSKPGLPHGIPVAVSVSPTINNTDGLLKLADAVGPHIAILQCHSDIVDDWSSRTVQELSHLARKHHFILWEGGRLLNFVPNLLGQNQYESRERPHEYVDMARKGYTRGHVSVASWASLASSWVSPVPPQKQYTDILIPVLKGAARETVAKMAQIIRTEITVDHEAPLDERSLSPHLLAVDSADGEEEPIARRASTISLTRSITQRSEPSSPALLHDFRRSSENSVVEERLLQYADNPSIIHSPPLLARGIMLCLPAVQGSPFLPWYRKSVLTAARANHDFVVGFLCNEPWTAVSQCIDILGPDMFGADPEDQEEHEEWNNEFFVIVSPLPANINRFQPVVYEQNSESDDDEDMDPTHRQPPELANKDNSGKPTAEQPQAPQARVLYTTLTRAIAARKVPALKDQNRTEKTSATERSGPDILHIPLITLGL